METLTFIGTCVYFAMLVGLSCYGLHRYWMLFLYYRHRNQKLLPQSRFTELPLVTVQLPIFNERYVIERLLDAVARLDYPRDRLEVQVLDDSADDTTSIAARKVAALRKDGLDIQLVRRADRVGFKAGALQHGLRTARGEFIAILDADFVPQPDLLRRIIDYFTDPRVGLVQARWGHLNDNHSLLTRVQSILLDGHFVIEHTARSRSGRFFNFNGTAGIWRRSCITDAGGWHADTLAEDLDLSYRAQMRGWKFLFLPEVVVPAELPVEMNAFKTQQHRWAKGSMQTCKKILPAVWRSPVPLKVKIEATIHLTSGLGYIMLLVMCLTFRVTGPTVNPPVAGSEVLTKLLLVDLPLFFAASVSVIAFYMCAQVAVHESGWKRLVYVPLLMGVGVGLSVNNARAVVEALCNHKTDFIRTPKYGLHTGRRPRRYRALRGLVPFCELAMGLYFVHLLINFIEVQKWSVVPFVLVMLCGFFYVGLLSLGQSVRPRFVRPAEPELSPASP